MHAEGDAIEEFRGALRAAGFTPPDKINADGKLYRFPTNGKTTDDAGWYVLHVDGVAAGAYGDWRRDINATWCSKECGSLKKTEHKRFLERLEAIKREREEDDRQRREDAASRALSLWNEAKPADPSHPYLQRKGIQPHHARAYGETLVIAVADATPRITSLQFISSDGSKKFLRNGKIGGCFGAIPGECGEAVAVCEGFATGASINEATGFHVYLALSLNNLAAVARMARQKHPTAQLVVAADNDATADGNPGIAKAREVAQAVGGVLAVPELDGEKCDFNDLHVRKGLDEVRRQIEQARGRVRTEGADLLNDVRGFVARFVAFPDPSYLDVVPLWAAHTHMAEHFHTTPRLVASSAEPESGKSRLLEVLELLSANPMLILSPSTAAIFRKLATTQLTLLIDECDTIFNYRGKDDQNEDLRALLNSGYRRGAVIPRCVGKNHEVQDFAVFAATALAGIGDLPETIMTRAIVLRMKRRASSEQIEPFRSRLHEAEGHALRARLAAWAKAVGPCAGRAWPDLPEGVVDRRAECWEPLIAVADLAGGEWPERARMAAVADVAAHRRSVSSLGIRLLADLRTVFADRQAMATADILKELHSLEEAPWQDLRGKALDSRGLAIRLKKYGIAPKTVRIGTATPKGYTKEDLHDAWERYLPTLPLCAATSATDATNATAADEAEL